jgi:TctA family transporter
MERLALIGGVLLDPATLAIILGCTIYGMVVGAVPGLTATMAVVLLVPFTWFLDPVPAVAAIVATTATAIFAGDIPGALLRIPGTPASAAYVEDSHRIARAGRARYVLSVSLLTAAVGGVIGTLILIAAAPSLARFALNFSSFEYFWLGCLGLSCAVLASASDAPGAVPKGFASLFLGLFVATIGIDVAVGHPRFTFGSTDLLGGVSFIPAVIGIFALGEVLRAAAHPTDPRAAIVPEPERAPLREAARTVWGQKGGVARSSVIGTVIGALPGAGADIAAWVCYAVSRRLSRTPERFGRGHVEGIVDGGSANNAAVSGAWTPAMVIGIPGDTVTAIAIGVLLLKGLTPGPRIFETDADLVAAIFGAFLIANLLMVPVGLLVIRFASLVLRADRRVLMPLILVFSLVGAYAVDATVTSVWVVLVIGLVAFALEERGVPVAPAILAIVLGPLIEQSFMTSMLKTQGDLTGFFERPVAAVLGGLTLLVWGWIAWRTVRPGVPA